MIEKQTLREVVLVQDNLKRVSNQSSRERKSKSVSEAFRSRYACFFRNRRLLRLLIDHKLPAMLDHAVRVHVWNCYRCRQVYCELKDLSKVKHDAENAAHLYGKITPLSPNGKGQVLTDNRELTREQKILIEKAEYVIERLRKAR